MEIEEITNMRRSERNIVENRVQVVAHKDVYVYHECEPLLYGKLQVSLIGRRVQELRNSSIERKRGGKLIGRTSTYFESRRA